MDDFTNVRVWFVCIIVEALGSGEVVRLIFFGFVNVIGGLFRSRSERRTPGAANLLHSSCNVSLVAYGNDGWCWGL